MSSNSTTTADLTVFEEWLQYIVFYVGCGIVGIVGNTAIAVGIIRTKNLRTRFFVVICTLVCVRVTLAFQFVVMGAHRALKSLQIIDVNQKRITCYCLHLFINISFTIELCLLLVLVIDRMMAIMAPMVYKNLSLRQAKIVCLSVVIVVGVFCKIIPSLIGWDFNEIVPCTNSFSSFSDGLKRFFQNVDLPIISIVILMYCVLWIVIKWRVTQLKRENDSEKEIQLRRKMAVLPLLRNIIVTHATLTLTAKLLIAIIVYIPSQAIRLTAISGDLNTIDLIANLIVLLWSNKELRDATWTACGTRSNPETTRTAPGVGNRIAVAPME